MDLLSYGNVCEKIFSGYSAFQEAGLLCHPELLFAPRDNFFALIGRSDYVVFGFCDT